jgi:hypothetical protein
LRINISLESVSVSGYNFPDSFLKAAMAILQYDPTRRFRLSRKWSILIAVIVALGSACLVLNSRFHSTSVCTDCGKFEYTTLWQLPLTDITYWTTTQEEETPLSRALAASGQIKPHEHDWHFAMGGGNRVFCALGDGQSLWMVSRLPSVGSLVTATYKFGSRRQISQLWTCLHDLKRADNIRILAATFPQAAEFNRVAYLRWADQNSKWWQSLDND